MLTIVHHNTYDVRGIEFFELKFKNAHESIFQLAGQAEAFKTAVVWSKHFARGGALES